MVELVLEPQCEYGQKSYHAIMDYRTVEGNATDAEVSRLIDAYRGMKLTVTGYTTYTAIKQVCGMSYPRIFSTLKTMHQEDPYSVKFTVNRMGENTKFALVNA